MIQIITLIFILGISNVNPLPPEILNIPSGPGIYFESLPDIYNVAEYWYIAGHIDINELKGLLRQIGELDARKLYKLCQDHLYSCDQTINVDLLSDREARITKVLQNIEETLIHPLDTFQDTPDFQNWFLPATGIINVNDSQFYSNAFESNSRDVISYLIDDKSILIRSEFRNDKDNIEYRYARARKIQNNDFSKMGGEQSDITRMRNALSNWTTLMEETHDKFLIMLQEIQQLILSTKNGKLHPKASVPRILKHAFSNLHTFTKPSIFPVPISQVSLGGLEKVSTMETSYYHGKFIYRLRIPILEPTALILYQIHSHPVNQIIHEKTRIYTFIKPRSKYLLLTPDQIYYTPLTQDQLDLCYNGGSFFICDKVTSMFKLTSYHQQCEVQLLTNPSMDTYRICDVKIKTAVDKEWTPFGMEDGWLFTLPEASKGLMMDQGKKDKRFILRGTGVVRLHPGQTLNVSNTLITGKKPLHAKSNPDVIPNITLDAYAIFPEVDYYEHEFLRLGYELDLHEQQRNYLRMKPVYAAIINFDEILTNMETRLHKTTDIQQDLEKGFTILEITLVISIGLTFLLLSTHLRTFSRWMRYRRGQLNERLNRAPTISTEFRIHYNARPRNLPPMSPPPPIPQSEPTFQTDPNSSPDPIYDEPLTS